MSLDLVNYPTPSDFFSSLWSHWRPPLQQTLSTWAEENFHLSSEYSASSSNLHLFGWQRAIFDSFTDPSVEQSVLMVSTQSVKTIFIQAAIAYIVDRDPGPILLIQPNDDDARTFSKERLSPMFRDNEFLGAKIYDAKGDTQSTLTGKLFNGGSLSLVGAMAPGNLARRTIRYLLCDEIDKYPISAKSGRVSGGGEGDPVRLAMERQATYQSRKKTILCCSPTVESTSRIGKAYATSDQRKPWVPCKKCKQTQIMRWSQVRWSSSVPRDKQPSTAYYECVHCHAHWNDADRRDAAEKSVWIADKPFNGIAGFWLSQLYTPWKKLSELVENFLQVKDIPSELQVFVNTVLAEQWKDAGDMPDHEVLMGRREHYPYGEEAIIPQRALFLTAFTDVQDSPPRLETEVVAWGRNRECWSVAYEVTQVFTDTGDAYPVTAKKVWDKLDETVLQRNWLHESGKYLPILAHGIDTGHRPKPVYEFARRHTQAAYNPTSGLRLTGIRTVVPTKGTPDDLRILKTTSKEDATRKRQGVRIIHIGTHAAKQELFDILRGIKPNPDGRTLSGNPVYACRHHPMYEESYFHALTAEARVVDEKTGKVTYEKRRSRNEALDCAVGNRAMSAVVGIDRFTEEQWETMEKQLSPKSLDPSGVTAASPSFTPSPNPSPMVDSKMTLIQDGAVERPSLVSAASDPRLAGSGAGAAGQHPPVLTQPTVSPGASSTSQPQRKKGRFRFSL